MAESRAHPFSADELRAIVRAATSDWSGATLEDHVREVCRLLRTVVPHTSVAAYVVRDVSAVPLMADGIDPESLVDYPAYYHRFDPMAKAFGDENRPITTLDGAAARQGVDIRRSPYLNDFLLGELGIRRVLGTNIPLASGVTLALSLHRAKNLSEFGEKDLIAIDAALPAVGRAFATTFARERSLELLRNREPIASMGRETSGIAEYTEDLEFVAASASARTLLIALEDAGGLHEALDVGRRLVARLKGDDSRSFLDCSLSKPTTVGLVSVRIVAVRLGSGIRVQLVLDRLLSKLELLVARAGERHQLTKREIEVLSLLLEGFNQAGIAERLGIAKTGVRDHLVNVRRKLDVRTNEQLLSRLLGLA